MKLIYTEEWKKLLEPVYNPKRLRVSHENPENKDDYVCIENKGLVQLLGVSGDEWIKQSIGLNDLEFFAGNFDACNTTLLYSFMYPYTDNPGLLRAPFACMHSVMPSLRPEMKETIADIDLKYPGFTQIIEDAANWYYSMLFSMLSSGARLDVKDTSGRTGVQVACCYETCAFMLAYAALHPDSEQSQTVIPLAFSSKNSIFHKPVNKQRLLQLVEELIPSLLESSIRTGFMQSDTAIQTSAIFERFKSMIPNLGESDGKVKVTYRYQIGSPPTHKEYDVNDPEVLCRHQYSFIFNNQGCELKDFRMA